ncbi:MAG: cobaltochelatase subunit CobN [Thermodesulfobacteria bacterium]|nr:cobaltochelatase subunit CobN [Thermodesulfobacteriota bacterium]
MRLVGILWQTYYNELFKAVKNLKIAEVKLYSARVLQLNKDLLRTAISELKKADVILLYRSSENCWEEIENFIKKQNLGAKIVALGNNPEFCRLSNVGAEVIEKAYKYLLIGGEQNLKNLTLFLLNIAGLKVEFKEPEELPWDGIYHPDANQVFFSIQDYLKWYEKFKPENTVGILFSRHYWINKNTEIEDYLIKSLEEEGLGVIPVFMYSLKDTSLGTRSGKEVIEHYFLDAQGKPLIAGLIKLVCFFLGSRKGDLLSGTSGVEEGVKLLKRLNIPVFSPIYSFYKTVEEWEKEELNFDIGWSIALPEFEGVIEPFIIGAQKDEEAGCRKRVAIKERIKRFAKRVKKWIELRNTPISERRVVFVLHNNPCASVEATVGCAAHLDSLESLARILKQMKKLGYKVSAPESGKALIEEIMKRKAISEFRWTTVEEIVKKGGVVAFVEKEKYLEWFKELPEKARNRMIEAWGNPPGEYKNGIPPAMLYQGKIVITGLRFGNALVCVQPKRGCAGPRCDGRVCKILHDPDVPPPHQYIATYKWFEKEFKAHIIVHVGTHGNLEFLPGKGVALSGACFPDIAINTLPHIYIYNSDNPPEGTIAKRRSYAVLVDHMQTVITQAGLPKEFEEIERLLEEYGECRQKDPSRLHILEHMIFEKVKKTSLAKELGLPDEPLHGKEMEKLVNELHLKFSLIRNSQIQSGMHIFGELPKGNERAELIYSIMRFNTNSNASIRREVAKLLGYELSKLLEKPEKVDEKTGKSYGAILEYIDTISKEVIKRILNS